jgi:hypothetical protein
MDTQPVAQITHSSQDSKGRFLPGNTMSKGRPKGSKQKLSIAFLADLERAWEEHGNSVIMRVIAERPQDFLKVIANILPRDVNLQVTQLDELSDEQLLRKLNALTEMARPLLARVVPSTPDPVDAEFSPVTVETTE